MKQSLIINTHSFIDVITNSSSELFICDTDKSIEFVKEILQSMINTYNVANPNNQITYKECFRDPYYAKDDFDALLNWIEYYVDTYPFCSKEVFKSFPKKDFRLLKYDEQYKLREQWVNDHNEEIKKEFANSILIESKDDNSIPYELFDVIERWFNATRMHLG